MVQVKRVRFGNGSIEFRASVPEVQASSVKEGNVTINNAAQPGIPAHYETSFMISIDAEIDGMEVNSVFHLNGVVVNPDQNASYRSVESVAASQLAPVLRSAADLIDRDIERFEKGESAPADPA